MRNILATIILNSFILSTLSFAQDVYEMEPMETTAKKVVLDESALHFPMAITGLRYEPQIDIMSRGFAEGQGDVSVRGGIFEGTGFLIGAATLYDPQTGHYFSEIPIAPEMLGVASVLTGVENAVSGFNSTSATVAYSLSPIRDSGKLSFSAGEDNLFKFRSFFSHDFEEMSVQLEYSTSESDGPIYGSDHDFERVSGRVNFDSDYGTTDFIAGYQDKYFAWPNMYTPYGVVESESIQTSLFLVNHKKVLDLGSSFELTAYYRNNKDHYIYDRGGLDYLFYHEMDSYAVAFAAELSLSDNFFIDVNTQYTADDLLESSSLNYGEFTQREYWKLAVLPRYEMGAFSFSAGGTWDVASHSQDALSPLAKIAYELSEARGLLYIEYSESTQLPGYTVLNGNSEAGLFRGNQELGREHNDSIEIGFESVKNNFSYQVALFYSEAEDMVDWVYPSDGSLTSAKQADAVDLDIWGFEAFSAYRFDKGQLICGYTYLDKDFSDSEADYAPSFYALNYAKHRFTLSVSYELLEGLSIRSDNEYRIQEENELRSGEEEPILSSLGLTWKLAQLDGFQIEGLVDNLWDVDYEEVPGVTPSPRVWSLGCSYIW